MKLKKLLATIVLATAGTFAVTAQTPMPTVPIDKDVRIGKLDNGLTYYLRHNNWPENRAEFYIAQKVGSLQENDIGVKFGADLNAYTSIDQTVYNISNVPTTRESIVDSCLMILWDWADGLLLEQEEIEKERGVIHEEWRLRTSAQMRMLERDLPKLYPGSKYGQRMPIGLMEIIDNFERPFLQSYYEKWYRPDNQGLIIVGDIDVDQVEQKIKQMFSQIAAPGPDAAKVELEPVPDNAEPIVIVDKDKEQKIDFVQVMFKHDATPDSMKSYVTYIFENYVRNCALGMLNARLGELAEQPDCPYLQAQVSDGQYLFAKTKDALNVSVVPKEGQMDPALTRALADTPTATSVTTARLSTSMCSTSWPTNRYPRWTITTSS